ncbi:MAG: SIR2 family protein [Verrucomicrobia bacterium]|nr:SIR2 family protein [Verrucomicrobiota bacterium]
MAEITKEQFIRDFAKAIEADQAALFIGAGMSAGVGFVDWRGLLRDIAADLKLDVDEEHDLIGLAQYEYNRNRNRSRLNQKIIEEFCSRATLSNSHRWIARLPVDTVWTTNYDTLLEQAYADAAKTVDVKHRKADLLLRVPYADVTLLKMHGDVTQPDEAVLIKDDYERYEAKRGLFTSRLQGDLTWKQFLFLGFSFTDPNIDYIFSRLRILLEEKADNQPPRYCILRRPSAPAAGVKDHSKLQAQYERDAKHLPHRIADLSRFNVEVILIDEYSEIEELLRQLCLVVSAKSILVSGSAHEYAPITRDKMDSFCRKLGEQIIKRGFNLVSGFGLGIAGSCIIGAHEQAKREKSGRLGQRLRLHPFPQEFKDDAERKKVYSDIREQLVKESGVTIFIAGNKLDRTTGKVVLADGVMQEFALAKANSHLLIPVPATGGAANEIWNEIKASPDKFYGAVDLRAEFAVLEDTSKSETEWVEAIFSVIKKTRKD